MTDALLDRYHIPTYLQHLRCVPTRSVPQDGAGRAAQLRLMLSPPENRNALKRLQTLLKAKSVYTG